MTLFETASLSDLARHKEALRDLEEALDSDGMAVTKSGLGEAVVDGLRDTLLERVRTTVPVWKPIDFGQDDFFWINRNDERSTVRAAFAQVNFFPWNPLGSRVIGELRQIFAVRNLLLKQPSDMYMNPTPGDEYSVRVSAQFYPSGEGWMQEHEDPRGEHQVALASVIMSKKGQHYTSGGMFTRDSEGNKIFPEDNLDPGDIFWFVPQAHHGVDMIDAGDDPRDNPYDGHAGRWILLCATNSLASGSKRVSATPLR